MSSERQLAGGAFVVGAVMLIGGAWQEKGLFSQEVAAWVQAVGSIVAILAAVWLQDRERRLSRLQELSEFLRGFRGCVRLARWLVETDVLLHHGELSEEERSDFEARLGGTILNSTSTALNAFDVAKLPTGQLVQTAITARIHFDLLVSRRTHPKPDYEINVGRVLDWIVDLEDLLDQSIALLPAPVLPEGPLGRDRITSVEQRAAFCAE